MIAQAPARPTVVLVGPPGALTAEVGAALALRLGVGLLDSDEQVEAVLGKSVAEVFVEDGEAVFRDHEQAVVLDGLQQHPGVFVVGGGAVMDPLVEQALAGHRVVFLDVGVAEAARRLGLNRERPVALGNPRGQWLRMLEHRRPVYERVATARVDTDGLTPDEVADAVLAIVEARDEGRP